MVQKLILCEGMVGTDVLQYEPIAGYLEEGLEVSSVSGFSTTDNRLMCLVLLSEPAAEETTPAAEDTPADNTQTEETTPPAETQTEGD